MGIPYISLHSFFRMFKIYFNTQKRHDPMNQVLESSKASQKDISAFKSIHQGQISLSCASIILLLKAKGLTLECYKI